MDVIVKVFYTWRREGAGDGPKAVELLSQEYPTTAEAVGTAVLLGSLDRVDYLPPPAAATAPTDVAHMCIGPTENAGGYHTPPSERDLWSEISDSLSGQYTTRREQTRQKF
ncbi:hypothetical protein FQR65_LT02579 [Abscondita terminalis]|nr:hypothetical protein FQR65_LT02579 [Abscondita terminalis]